MQVHSDNIDNSNKSRTSGAIALMSAGNLEGSWYYMLLSNEQIVKRTKATVLPVPDEVITHLNKLSANRKIRRQNNTNQPLFEQSKRVIPDDGLDYDDDTIYNITNRRISSPVDAHSDELYDTVYEDVVYNEPMNIDTHAMDEVTDVNEAQFETDDVDIGPDVYDDTLMGYDAPEVESTCDGTGFSTTFLPSVVPYSRPYRWLRVLPTSRS